MRKKVYSLLVMGLMSLLACEKQVLPDVKFDTSIRQDQLQGFNSFILIDGGVAGLIVTKRSDGTFRAFDRCSTVNSEKKCQVVPDQGGLNALDLCSGAKFNLDDGSPAKGEAKEPLKQYKVYPDGSGFLRISN